MSIHTKKTIIFLMGATTAGKTNLAILLAKRFAARLISVDSALIYQKMDIGTGKPSRAILQKYPHYLIDIIPPEQSYSAHDFVKDASAQINAAFANQQIPILVGGASFYFRALEFGLSDLPESSKQSRAKFNQLLRTEGVKKLWQRLKKIDPITAKKIHPNDPQRITRALEVFALSGKTLSQLQGHKQGIIDYKIKKIILLPERAELHLRIEKRFLTMMKNGFLDEVKTLYQNPNLHENMPSMRSIGYRQAWQHLDGKFDEKVMIEKSINATRQLCKRQHTWLKSEKNGLILANPDLAKIMDYLQK